MTNYENEIMENLKGGTPRQKLDYLISINELFEEMVGLYSKQYDDEECGIHFKQRMEFLINKYQS